MSREGKRAGLLVIFCLLLIGLALLIDPHTTTDNVNSRPSVKHYKLPTSHAPQSFQYDFSILLQAHCALRTAPSIILFSCLLSIL